MSLPTLGLTTAPIVSVREALSYFAEVFHCSWADDEPIEVVVSDELRIGGWIDPYDEDPELADYLDAKSLLLVIFSVNRRIPEPRYMEVETEVIEAVTNFLEAHRGPSAVLTYDYERVLLRRIKGDEIEIDSYAKDPEGFNLVGPLAGLTRRYPVRDLEPLIFD